MNGAMPSDSLLSTWHEFWRPIEEKTDHPINIQRTMRGRIEAAGFQNIHEKEYNCPIGQWPKHRVYKDAGTTNMMTWKNGTEGMLAITTKATSEADESRMEHVPPYEVWIAGTVESGAGSCLACER